MPLQSSLRKHKYKTKSKKNCCCTTAKEDEAKSPYLDNLLSHMGVVQVSSNKTVCTSVPLARIRHQCQRCAVTPTKVQNNITTILRTPFCASILAVQDPQSHWRDCTIWSLYVQPWELNTPTAHNYGALCQTHLIAPLLLQLHPHLKLSQTPSCHQQFLPSARSSIPPAGRDPFSLPLI